MTDSKTCITNVITCHTKHSKVVVDLEEIITLRMSKENKAALEDQAKIHGLNLSAYCRMILYAHIEEVTKNEANR